MSENSSPGAVLERAVEDANLLSQQPEIDGGVKTEIPAHTQTESMAELRDREGVPDEVVEHTARKLSRTGRLLAKYGAFHGKIQNNILSRGSVDMPKTSTDSDVSRVDVTISNTGSPESGVHEATQTTTLGEERANSELTGSPEANDSKRMETISAKVDSASEGWIEKSAGNRNLRKALMGRVRTAWARLFKKPASREEQEAGHLAELIKESTDHPKQKTEGSIGGTTPLSTDHQRESTTSGGEEEQKVTTPVAEANSPAVSSDTDTSTSGDSTDTHGGTSVPMGETTSAGWENNHYMPPKVGASGSVGDSPSVETANEAGVPGEAPHAEVTGSTLADAVLGKPDSEAQSSESAPDSVAQKQHEVPTEDELQNTVREAVESLKTPVAPALTVSVDQADKLPGPTLTPVPGVGLTESISTGDPTLGARVETRTEGVVPGATTEVTASPVVAPVAEVKKRGRLGRLLWGDN